MPAPSKAKPTVKYRAWADTLLVPVTLGLERPVYFWANAWDHDGTGIWEELGPTRLAFLEYPLIGVAGLTSPHLLNREGIGR